MHVRTLITSAKSSQESKAEQHGEPESAVLAIVGGRVEGKDESETGQTEEESSTTEQVGEEVDVGAGSGRQDAHGQASVDALQVRADRSLTGNKTIIMRRYSLPRHCS